MIGVRAASRWGEGAPDPASKGSAGREEDTVQRMERKVHIGRVRRPRGGKREDEPGDTGWARPWGALWPESESWDLIHGHGASTGTEAELDSGITAASSLVYNLL